MFQFPGFAFDPYVFRTKYLLSGVRSQSPDIKKTLEDPERSTKILMLVPDY